MLNTQRRSKLELAWHGPYKVLQRLNDVNYRIQLTGKRNAQAVVHINLLKLYYRRPEPLCCSVIQSDDELGTLNLPNLPTGTPSVKDDSPSITPRFGSILTEEQKRQVQEVMAKFPTLFSDDPGRTHLIQHHIKLTSKEPVQEKPYRMPFSVREQVKQEIDELLRLGLIVESDSEYAAPVLLVRKPGQTGVRLVVDYRGLNAKTVTDSYPMVRIDELFERIGRAKYLTTLDLTKGYHQVPVAPDSQKLTAFTTPFGLYHYLFMPFGVKNGPRTFQRLMDRILAPFRGFAWAYLDDVVIASLSWEEHLSHLTEVFKGINEAGLTVKLSKCQIAQDEVLYLGHRIGRGEIQPDPIKIQNIQAFPPPSTKRQLRAFLGTVGYYQRFIAGYSLKAAPLTDMLRKTSPTQLKWSSPAEESFRELREALTGQVTLQVADPNKPFTIFTDASDRGIAGILTQLDDHGEERPLLYLSRKLNPTEQRYSTIEREALAVVWTINKLKAYLYGNRFTIVTDHKPLVWLKSAGEKNNRLLRWSLSLQDFEFEVVHRKGSLHSNADGLSRLH